MSNLITAEELAAMVQKERDLNVAFDQARGPSILLTFADWDYIIEVLREREAKPVPDIRWEGNLIYRDERLAGECYMSPYTNSWYWKLRVSQPMRADTHFAANEDEARAAVERAVRDGS